MPYLADKLYRFVGHIFFQFNEMILNSFFIANSRFFFLKYIFEFVFNMAQTALNAICWSDRSSMEKVKSNTFLLTCLFILSSVVVRKSLAKQDVRVSIPS